MQPETTHPNSALSNIDKSFSGKSILLMISGAVRMLAQIAVLLLYVRFLSVPDYGIYQSAWLYINIFTVLSLFGLPQLILSVGWQNIIGYLKQHQKLYFGFIITGLLLPPLLISLLNPEFHWIEVILITLNIWALNIGNIREMITLKNSGHVRVVISNFVYALLWFGVHVFMMYYEYNLALLLGLLSITAIVKASLLHTTSRHHHAEISPHIIRKEWFYLGLFDSINVFQKWIDKWLILLFLSITQFAIYFNGAYEIPVFGLMVSAVGNMLLVSWAQQQKANIQPLLYQSAFFLSVFIIPAFSFLWIYHQPFFLTIFGQDYIESIPIFSIALWMIPVRILNYTAALQYLHRSDVILKGAILDLVVAGILMAALYPIWQMQGIILAMVAATWVQATYYLIMTSRLSNLPIAKLVPIKQILVMFLGSILLSYTIYDFTSALDRWWHMGWGALTALINLAIYWLIYRKLFHRGLNA